jgi:uncharacterized membrane protein
MLIVAVVLRWCHILLAITWFGSTLYRSLILFPSLKALPPAEQCTLGRDLQERQDTIIIIAALLVILFGILLGTVVGPIQTTEALASAYGLTWLAGLALAAAVLVWQIFVTGGAQEVLFADETADTTAIMRQWRRLQAFSASELGGFGLILLCMVLLHYGN